MRFFFLFSLVLHSCSNDPELVKGFISSENLPIEIIEGAEILHTENGVLKVKIISTSIKRFKDIQPKLVFSNGLEVIFYNDSGLVKSVLKADNAKVYDNNIMTATGNVILNSSEAKKLETNELTWDENKNKIYTDNKVVISTGKEVIEGSSFESNSDFSEYSISNINGIIDFQKPIE